MIITNTSMMEDTSKDVEILNKFNKPRDYGKIKYQVNENDDIIGLKGGNWELKELHDFLVENNLELNSLEEIEINNHGGDFSVYNLNDISKMLNDDGHLNLVTFISDHEDLRRYITSHFYDESEEIKWDLHQYKYDMSIFINEDKSVKIKNYNYFISMNDYDDEFNYSDTEKKSLAIKRIIKFIEYYDRDNFLETEDNYLQNTVKFYFDDQIIDELLKDDILKDTSQVIEILREIKYQNSISNIFGAERSVSSIIRSDELDLSGINDYSKLQQFFEIHDLEKMFFDDFTLNLSSNSIESLNLIDFKCKNLITLDLSNNKIRTIKSSTFSKLPKLTNLYLKNNDIFELSNDIFENNKVLTQIDISNNPITELPKSLLLTNIEKIIVDPTSLPEELVYGKNSLSRSTIIDWLKAKEWVQNEFIQDIIKKTVVNHTEILKSKFVVNLHEPKSLDINPYELCWDHISDVHKVLYNYIKKTYLDLENYQSYYDFVKYHLQIQTELKFESIINDICQSFEDNIKPLKLFISMKERKNMEEILFGEISQENKALEDKYRNVTKINPIEDTMDVIIKQIQDWKEIKLQDDSYIKSRKCCKMHGRLGDALCNICGRSIPDDWVVAE